MLSEDVSADGVPYELWYTPWSDTVGLDDTFKLPRCVVLLSPAGFMNSTLTVHVKGTLKLGDDKTLVREMGDEVGDGGSVRGTRNAVGARVVQMLEAGQDSACLSETDPAINTL